MKKTPHRRAGSVLPYSRVDDIYLSHHPWDREAHSRPVFEGLFLSYILKLNDFLYATYYYIGTMIQYND